MSSALLPAIVKCKTCGASKPRTAEYFSPAPTCRDGLRPVCRACANELHQMRRMNALTTLKPGLRLCKVCGVVQPIDNFPVCDTRTGIARRKVCRPCWREQQRLWRHEHPESARLAHRRWADKNRAVVRASARRWYAANRDKKRLWTKRWRLRRARLQRAMAAQP